MSATIYNTGHAKVGHIAKNIKTKGRKMEFMLLVIGVVAFVIIIITMGSSGRQKATIVNSKKYFYSRKDFIMSEAETSFFHQLQRVARDRYFVFPQIHLSSLMQNRTNGRYWRAALSRINQKSVDYVLCDKETLKSVYAVELDDRTHDSQKRRKRDEAVEEMLEGVGLPLVRFRNVHKMSDEDIAGRFEEAAGRNIAVDEGRVVGFGSRSRNQLSSSDNGSFRQRSW